MPGIFKPQPRAVDKREQRREKERNWIDVRRDVLTRDQHRCRCCRLRATDVHHIRPRSVRGPDSTKNCCALCRLCHGLVQTYRVTIDAVDQALGADGELVFYNNETDKARRVLRPLGDDAA
jgi:hypothetical protein